MYEKRRNLLMWLGLAAAFSPVLLNLLEGLRDHPDQRYTLLAPLLIALLLHHDPESRCTRRVGVGIVLLATGFVAQSIGIAAGSWSISRYGLPVGMLGVALLAGGPSLGVVALAFWAIPLPGFIRHLASPGAESMLGSGAAEVLSWAGVEIEVGGPLLSYRGEWLELAATDNGMVTASALAAAGWFMALRFDRSLATAAVKAMLWAGCAVIAQPVIVVLGVATLPLGAAELGRFLLSDGPWLALAALALLLHASHGSGAARRTDSDIRVAD